MKTLKTQISLIALFIALIMNYDGNTQNSHISKGTFLRVYNLEGKKVNKGKLHNVSDTAFTIKRNGKFINFNYKNIGYIKTKRSAGHNVIMGSIIGGTSMAILGAATADPYAWIYSYTASEGAVAGAAFGGIAGACIGGISILFKNSTTFIIDGDVENWNAFVKYHDTGNE